MKKMWDKLSKTILCTVTVLMFSTTIIKDDASFTKNIEMSDNKSEVVIITPSVKEYKPLSRGYTYQKPISERETINIYVRGIALRYNIEPEFIMSIIQQESDYNPNCKTGKCLGLMQVSTIYHKDRAARLGVTNFYDPYGNILLGVDYLSELLTEYKDPKLVLMLYNMKRETAFRLYNAGRITSYVKDILARADKFKKGE